MSNQTAGEAATPALARDRDRVESRSGDLFLERIPEPVYTELTETLRRRYGFLNGAPAGGRLRMAEYFVGLRRSAAETLLKCVREMLTRGQAGDYPSLPVPAGFRAPSENLPAFDRDGGIPFGYFDVAVTAEGLRFIEVQSTVTYAITGAFAGGFLQRSLPMPGSSVFVNEPDAEWQDLIELKRRIVVGPENHGQKNQGIAVADRDLRGQKTAFEHYAIQRELGANIDVIDTRWIFENGNELWYKRPEGNSSPRRLRRLIHRTLPIEAMEEDGYPQSGEHWRFRFDRAYSELIQVSHPGLNFALSKHILPYVSDPINPPCYELAEIAESLRRGDVGYDELVWKSKIGVAGRGLFLLPDQQILQQLTEADLLGDYIAQSKVDFERLRTGDGGEKIVELRFMSVQSADRLLVVPMARIGHVRARQDGRLSYHIHFAENNRPGYGFCPVLVVDD